MILNVSKFC